jgi:DNA invertase Pin-like site-specific DNA recombinase
MKTCFSYIRFSSRIQAQGDSESRQLEIAPRIAKEKGWTLRQDLCAQNLGVSAYKGDNIKTLQSIIEAAKLGKIPQGAVMILEAVDRLTRMELDAAYDLFRDLLRVGVELYIDKGSRHYTRDSLKSPTDLLMVIMELAAAHEYSFKLSERVGSAWRKKKLRASEEILTAMRPSWLDIKTDSQGKRTFEVNDKADIIRRIFKEYSRNVGIRTIGRALNDENIDTHGKGKQSKGNGWAATHIRRILGYRQVIGEYQPCKYIKVNGRKIRIPEGEPIANYYPAIVDKPLFYDVQGKLSQATGEKGKFTGGLPRGRTGNATNLFKGFIKCRHCECSMVIKQSGNQRGYSYTSLVCSNQTRGNGCGPFATIQYAHVERAVLTVLFSKLLPGMNQQDSKAEKLITLQGELKVNKERIAQMTADYDNTPSNLVAQSLARQEGKQKELMRDIETLTATMADDGLTGWEPVENTIENRLRLGALLRNEVESLLIDAKGLQAILTLKDPACSFKLTWESKNGNHMQANSASERFTMEGESLKKQQSPYLDKVLVWQSAHNKGQVIDIAEAA